MYIKKNQLKNYQQKKELKFALLKSIFYNGKNNLFKIYSSFL